MSSTCVSTIALLLMASLFWTFGVMRSSRESNSSKTRKRRLCSIREAAKYLCCVWILMATRPVLPRKSCQRSQATLSCRTETLYCRTMADALGVTGAKTVPMEKLRHPSTIGTPVHAGIDPMSKSLATIIDLPQRRLGPPLNVTSISLPVAPRALHTPI